MKWNRRDRIFSGILSGLCVGASSWGVYTAITVWLPRQIYTFTGYESLSATLSYMVAVWGFIGAVLFGYAAISKE